jgi:cobalt-zinc-cadmium efflux system protein
MHVHGTPTAKMQRVLRISFVATLCYTVITFIAGLHAHSLALVSEAGHNASDALALILSFVAVYFQGRPPDNQKTFGYQRAGVLAAFLNALALIVIAIWIAIEAIDRFEHPHPIEANIMMIVAAAGVIMNGVIAAMLWRVGKDVNIRSVFIHMLGDTLSTAAVIIGGLAILYTGMIWIDPALSIAIAAMIFWSSFGIVRETLNILLEGTPHGISLDEIRVSLTEIDGVEGVHDLHVWSLGSNSRALATHIQIADISPSESCAILDRIHQVLHDRFHILHATVQFENAACDVAESCAALLESDHNHDHAHAHGHFH